MTEHEIPQEGGSFIRGKDGKLTRIDDAAPIEAPAPAADAPKPAAKHATHKKER